MVGCRKDPTIIDQLSPNQESGCEETLCNDFPIQGGISFGYQYQLEGPQYRAPFYNPNNSDEFIYLRTGVSGTELVKYTISTKDETVLCNTANISTQPQWGSQGWIVFTVIGNRIWKIYEDGAGLQQITDFESFRPRFSLSGDRFICMGSHPAITLGYRPILDLNGNLIDSIYMEYDNCFTGYPYWPLNESFSESYQFYSDHNSPGNKRIGVCKLTEDPEYTELNSFIYNRTINDLTANYKTVFYSEHWGPLWKVNLSTLETTAFKMGCQTRYYNHICISSDGKSILVEKIINLPLDEYHIDEKHEIWLLDVNNCDATRILGQ